MRSRTTGCSQLVHSVLHALKLTTSFSLFCVSVELLSFRVGIVLKLVKRGSQVFVNRSSFVNFVNIFFIVSGSGFCLSAEFHNLDI